MHTTKHLLGAGVSYSAWTPAAVPVV